MSVWDGRTVEEIAAMAGEEQPEETEQPEATEEEAPAETDVYKRQLLSFLLEFIFSIMVISGVLQYRRRRQGKKYLK